MESRAGGFSTTESLSVSSGACDAGKKKNPAVAIAAEQHYASHIRQAICAKTTREQPARWQGEVPLGMRRK